MIIGIEQYGFYTPKYYINLIDLLESRGLCREKEENRKISIPGPDEDVVTMAAESGKRCLDKNDKDNIDLLIIATESGIDQAKSAGMFVHGLLKLKKTCRVIELKQSCYSATCGLLFAINTIKASSKAKVLLIASDIARYKLQSIEETSQGAGSIAMIISSTPKIASFDINGAVYAEDSMDFFRPNNYNEAILNSKLSIQLYLSFLEKTFRQYSSDKGLSLNDFSNICYHCPTIKLVEKAHIELYKKFSKSKKSEKELRNEIKESLVYPSKIGNCYTASLYVSLISMLENSPNKLDNKTVGLYSYGSGAIAEFFSCKILPSYQSFLKKTENHHLLKSRQCLSLQEYQNYHQNRFIAVSNAVIQKTKSGFRLNNISNNKRIYTEE